MEDEIIKSWQKNAAEWVRIIEKDKIPSRIFTNEAIVTTLASITAIKILDMGCGEGWLTRRMCSIGKKAVGVDAIAMLLNTARAKGDETYYQISYEEIINGKLIPEAPFDAIVFNFSIYQNELLLSLLKQTKKAVLENGYIIIQTLHPFFLIQQGLEYKSQRVNDSWEGLSGNFIDGHSWYARTFEDWINVFEQCNLRMYELKEICNQKHQPVSVIFKVK